jgi:hypothetical protein
MLSIKLVIVVYELVSSSQVLIVAIIFGSEEEQGNHDTTVLISLFVKVNHCQMMQGDTSNIHVLIIVKVEACTTGI